MRLRTPSLRPLAALDQREGVSPLGAFVSVAQDEVRSLATAAARRFAAGAPRGPLDGIPLPVKDEIDCRPYPTSVGTSFLGRSPASDASVSAPTQTWAG